MSSSTTVVSPVTGEAISEYAEAGAEGVRSAVERARAATGALRALTVWERADLLQLTADALAARSSDAVEEHIVEHGKTRAHAEAEIEIAIGGLRSIAESARRTEGRITRAAASDVMVLTEREPLGVVGAITPWNVPFMVPIEYAAPALAMGNAVVWKGAESVPRTSAYVQEAFERAGWPDGAITLLEGGPITGAALARCTDLDALCFTGSSEVGIELASIGGMRRLILELGGNGPTIVFADADIERAAERIIAGMSFLSGQSCAATERVLVERSVHDVLLEALVERARSERVGDPRDPNSTLGPIHLTETSEKIARQISGALEGGAKVLIGGKNLPDAPTSQYWEPAVISGVTPEMEVFAEETFGPVAPVTGFASEAEALRLATIGGYGLSSAVFTADLDRAFRVSRALPASYVVVNETSNYWEMHLPWGGGPGTRSGIGRLGGDHALGELSTSKSTVVRLAPHHTSIDQPEGGAA